MRLYVLKQFWTQFLRIVLIQTSWNYGILWGVAIWQPLCDVISCFMVFLTHKQPKLVPVGYTTLICQIIFYVYVYVCIIIFFFFNKISIYLLTFKMYIVLFYLLNL